MCESWTVKNNENQIDEGAGRAESGQLPAAVMTRTQMRHSTSQAYRHRYLVSGRRDVDALRVGLEDGQTIYWKRRSGKVASFFRCLLR